MAIYLGTAHKKGISSHQFSKRYWRCSKECWFMLHRIRQLMSPQEDVKFSGVVEVDEVYIGDCMKNKHKKERAKFKNHLGHAGNKTGVMGLVERGKGLKVVVIDSIKNTLKEMIRGNVEITSTIITDALVAHKGLDREFAKYEVIYLDKK